MGILLFDSNLNFMIAHFTIVGTPKVNDTEYFNGSFRKFNLHVSIEFSH